MYFSTLSSTILGAVALLSTTALSAPLQSRQFAAQITFHGATPEAFFTQAFPADGSLVKITNPLSITSITSLGGASCSFLGIDGSQTTVVGANTAVVGPPQTQVQGSCLAL
ncbi:MAG: hypothetical protein MMC33_006530 [Icmadophila ericetorum]|nr:hypothetical protein [Icmadophila ericetorum]